MPKGDDADDNQGDAFDRLEGITRTDHPNPKANAYKGHDYADDEKTSVIQQELGNHCLVTSSYIHSGRYISTFFLRGLRSR